MAKNKQRFNANRQSETTNTPVELPTEDEVQETEVTETTENTETEEVQEEIVTPEVHEIVFSQPSVNLEEEQERIRRDQSVGDLTKDEVMNKVGVTARMSLLGVINYIDEMRKFNGNRNIFLNNRNYIENAGPAMQVQLFNNIMDIITKTDDVDFRYSMDYLMKLFDEEGSSDGPLSLISLSRFQENLRLGVVELRCYPNLMRMLTVLCNPITRAKEARTTISFERSLEYGFSDAAKNRLISYFTH